MKTPRPVVPPRSMEAGIGALGIVSGGFITLLAAVAGVLWLFGKARAQLIWAGALFGSLLLALGIWLWRRSKAKDVRPIDARILFVLLIVLPLLQAATGLIGMDTISSFRSQLKIVFLIVYGPIGAWFFVRYVLPEARR